MWMSGLLEYSGLDPANPLDVKAGAAGSGTSASSGAATTTSANDLIFGAGMTIAHFTGAGTGFVSRIITAPGRGHRGRQDGQHYRKLQCDSAKQLGELGDADGCLPRQWKRRRLE